MNDHNHSAPVTPKVKEDIKKKVISQLKVGAKPSVIHKELVNNSESSSRKDIPTVQQMYNWKHNLTMEYLPSPDAIANIIQNYSNLFLQAIELHPVLNIALASTWGLNVLSNCKHTIIDGTFELCEKKLILTTVMAYRDGIAVPCAYLLSNSKEQENYKAFFEVIQQVILIDF